MKGRHILWDFLFYVQTDKKHMYVWYIDLVTLIFIAIEFMFGMLRFSIYAKIWFWMHNIHAFFAVGNFAIIFVVDWISSFFFFARSNGWFFFYLKERAINKLTQFKVHLKNDCLLLERNFSQSTMNSLRILGRVIKKTTFLNEKVVVL